MKDLSRQVWPVENYTDKIHMALGYMFRTSSHLTFTVSQMRTHISQGYHWLQNNTVEQTTLLDKLIQTGIKKLIQKGEVKKVLSKVSVERQWQATAGVKEGSMVNVTSDESVATTEAAKKAIGRRAVNPHELWTLNHPIVVNGSSI